MIFKNYAAQYYILFFLLISIGAFTMKTDLPICNKSINSICLKFRTFGTNELLEDVVLSHLLSKMFSRSWWVSGRKESLFARDLINVVEEERLRKSAQLDMPSFEYFGCTFIKKAKRMIKFQAGKSHFVNSGRNQIQHPNESSYLPGWNFRTV